MKQKTKRLGYNFSKEIKYHNNMVKLKSLFELNEDYKNYKFNFSEAIKNLKNNKK